LLIWQTLNQNNPSQFSVGDPKFATPGWPPGGHRAKLRAGWPAANAGRHAQRLTGFIGLGFENAPFTALGNPRSSTVNFEPRTVTDTAPRRRNASGSVFKRSMSRTRSGMETGSRQENASNQESKASFRFPTVCGFAVIDMPRSQPQQQASISVWPTYFCV
jgi:hypothetical protein